MLAFFAVLPFDAGSQNRPFNISDKGDYVTNVMFIYVTGHLALFTCISASVYWVHRNEEVMQTVSRRKRIFWPTGAGLLGAMFLMGLYFGIVSWAESPQHAVDLFWEDRRIVLPIIVGFGLQMALYVILKKRLFLPVAHTGPSGKLAGASGGMSTAAMVACCAHHVTDVLPILGLTAAGAFLAQYRIAFMSIGLSMTLLGIIFMLVILFRERRKAIHMLNLSTEVV